MDRTVTPMMVPQFGVANHSIQTPHGSAGTNEFGTIHNDPNISAISKSLGVNKFSDSIYESSQSVLQEQQTDMSTISLKPSKISSLPKQNGFMKQTISY